MKTILFLVALTHCFYLTLAQTQISPKKPIDFQAHDEWPEIRDQRISNDGKCISYNISSEKDGTTLIIQAADNTWKKAFKGGYNASFTEDSRRVIFNCSPDSLAIFDTKTQHIKTISGAGMYKVPENGTGHWVAYLSAGNAPGELTLLDLSNGKQSEIDRVSDYYFSPTGNVVLCQRQVPNSDTSSWELLWVDLHSGKRTGIAKSSSQSSDFAFDQEGTQLAFIQGHDSGSALFYYRAGDNKVVLRADNSNPGLKDTMAIASGQVQFSGDGKKIFFHLRPKPTQNISRLANTAQVDIWSYQDDFLQSQQLNKLKNESERSYWAAINTGSSEIIRLENEQDDWTTFEMAADGNAEYISVRTRNDFSQEEWNTKVRQNLYLVSTSTGERKTIARQLLMGLHDKLYSPKGRYVIWYDREKGNYFSYNTTDGNIRNITQSIPVPLFNDEDDHPGIPMAIGIAGWLEGDEAVFLYDRYDIWQVDPDGTRPPLNVTNGYGRRNKIYLRYLALYSRSWEASIAIAKGEKLLLCAFNRVTKDNGFFSKKQGTKGDPVQLVMGPHLYYYCFNFLPTPEIRKTANLLLKAENAEAYLLNRMNATEYPNLYTTTDLKSFTRVSNLQPQQNYNWLTSEFVKWKTFDGHEAEGILYKPENFDPEKKYPVIFYFYEKDANALHYYLTPGYSDGPINIPSFVSNGYLVFDPNIHYKVGEPRESVYNSVVSAARYLSQMPWVDSTKMGIQGHSFGGYEVNCLVSRTSLFAAAASAAGFCNLTSLYGNLRMDFGVTGLNWIEKGQTGLGVTLWEDQDKFIQNSPLFYADNVSTPLLIMHNAGDGASPYSQSVEFFTALRRLHKKVWMLQYDKSSHQVEGEANCRDYSMRLFQFFDHYLKGHPAPRWMTQGVPAKEKGLKSGLELGN